MKRVVATLMTLIIVLSMFWIFGSQAEAISLPPVGYWKFDEGSGTVAGDSSGNGNSGTVNGAQWVDCVKGKALKFDGINDYVYVPHSSSLDISGHEISVEYWVKFPTGWYPGIPTGGDDAHIIFDKGDAYTACFYGSTGTHVFNIPYVPPYPATNKNTWDANVWYHIADVFDGSQIRMYVNGVLDKAETVIGSVSRSGLNLAIGSHCSGGMRFFSGLIDEFAIYNYARTAEEIWNDYLGGVAPPPPPSPVGGKATPINIPMNKPETPTLWIWLTTMILPMVVTAIYVKRRKEKQ